MAYSIDYKKRAVAYKQEGHTFKQLREVFGIPSETYYDWKEKLESNYYEKKIKRERFRKIDRERLKEAVDRKPDAFLYELAELFERNIKFEVQHLVRQRKPHKAYSI